MRDNSTGIRIGFAFDVPVADKASISPDSVTNEYEDNETIDWIRGVLASLGEVVDLPWGSGFVEELAGRKVDVLFNITEASGGRNRESLVPAVAEALGVSCTGSDAVCLGLALDKYVTKIIARHLGIATPDFFRLDGMGQWEELLAWMGDDRGPVIAKPNTGGSSQGIRESCRAATPSELRDAVEWIVRDCGDSALVEAFVTGREVDCGLLEGRELRVLPLAEMRFSGGDPEAFNSIENKGRHQREILCPAPLPERTARRIEAQTVELYRALGCRDLARADFRLSADETPYLLEINPLPGLSPYRSAYPVLLRTAGMEPEHVIRQMVENARRRALGGGANTRGEAGKDA